MSTVTMKDEGALQAADALEAEYLAVANGHKKPGKLDLETLVRAVQELRRLARGKASTKAVSAATRVGQPRDAGLTDGDVFTLIGHAEWLRGNGAEDMPDWCLGLASRIAQGIDPYLARRVNDIREEKKPRNQDKAG
ncbi:hypothetical protein KTD31_01860 [Burkholderia multivorans]|jgi:hypothetical protein|uniref:hypothetical protein n=1 Tax=Burkholderia multivorans TaxID=87883 RepID=UPI001C22A65F|nr:hypothetical protein [Burkholderia multivorans]MBU9200149.1 hypothetical protein [Burkholderia multivorans]MDN8078730.1 hypothetical protein [Burkholderia multivorans]